MARYLVFARTDYAEPLGLIDERDALPTLEEVGSSWLEVAVVPADAAIWVLRDGEALR